MKPAMNSFPEPVEVGDSLPPLDIDDPQFWTLYVADQQESARSERAIVLAFAMLLGVAAGLLFSYLVFG
jgi:hypothetical protein